MLDFRTSWPHTTQRFRVLAQGISSSCQSTIYQLQTSSMEGWLNPLTSTDFTQTGWIYCPPVPLRAVISDWLANRWAIQAHSITPPMTSTIIYRSHSMPENRYEATLTCKTCLELTCAPCREDLKLQSDENDFIIVCVLSAVPQGHHARRWSSFFRWMHKITVLGRALGLRQWQ